MATQVTLKAELRQGRGKGQARKLRASGQLPAVLYGAGADPLSLTLDEHDAVLLFQSISVDNTIINLDVEGEKVPVPTLVREIQTHPARPAVLHVDFLRIQSGVEVELDVPVTLDGIPEGVRTEGGVLEQTVHEIPIRCLPKDIPAAFVVDVTDLTIGDAVRVGDIPLVEGVEVLLDMERMVCSVQPPTELVIEEEEVEEEEEGVEAELAEGEEPAEAEEEAEAEDEGE